MCRARPQNASDPCVLPKRDTPLSSSHISKSTRSLSPRELFARRCERIVYASLGSSHRVSFCCRVDLPRADTIRTNSHREPRGAFGPFATVSYGRITPVLESSVCLPKAVGCECKWTMDRCPSSKSRSEKPPSSVIVVHRLPHSPVRTNGSLQRLEIDGSEQCFTTSKACGAFESQRVVPSL